jgi:hypothetical protein
MFGFLHFNAKNCSNLMQVFNVFTWKWFNTLLKHVAWFGMNIMGIEFKTVAKNRMQHSFKSFFLMICFNLQIDYL